MFTAPEYKLIQKEDKFLSLKNLKRQIISTLWFHGQLLFFYYELSRIIAQYSQLLLILNRLCIYQVLLDLSTNVDYSSM
jgi:hypothetical protein